MTVADIANKIKKAHSKHTPTIIAVEGFGGAGKSTFAAELKDKLGDAYVVEIDDFFLKGKPSDGDKSNFDRKRLGKQILSPLKNGQPATYQKLEYDANTLSEFIRIPDVKYLIIEGVSAFHPSIVAYMDYKIWIEAPMGVAEERMRKRDEGLGIDSDDLRKHWTSTYQDYKDRHRPEEIADFVFDNSVQSYDNKDET